ncbi:hypothetical protein Tco_1012286 [Tanacetum coccineum]
MSSLVEFAILNGADNIPLMLDKLIYASWNSRMELYMENRENGYLILDSIRNDPLVWPTIEENREMRRKRVPKLSAPEKLQYEADVKATNIILQGVPTYVYALVSHHRESMSQYYHRFAQLINDMHIYQMRLQQFQVNSKFLNSLLPEWSKFVIDVKLVKDLHVTNFDQLFIAHLEHHEAHANEIHSGLAVSVFNKGDDPIDAINKMMLFLSTMVTSRFPSTNNQLRNSSNPRQQATIQIHMTLIVMKITNAKFALMANLSHYGSDALAEVYNLDNLDNNMINQAVQSVEIDRLKQTLSEHFKSIGSLRQTVTLLKKDQSAQTVHMLTKPQFSYDIQLNKLLRFSSKSFYYLKKASGVGTKLYDDPTLFSRPTKVEVPKEIPKVSMVITSFEQSNVVNYTETEITSTSNIKPNKPNKIISMHLVVQITQSQEKDTVVKKLKDRIKSLSRKMNEDKIKKDLEEIETINIELDHRVSKLIAENEHLK